MSLAKAKDLREERQNIAEQMKHIIQEPEGEDGLPSNDQNQKFDRLDERFEELTEEIETLEAEAREFDERSDRLSTIQNHLEDSQGVRAGRQDTRDIDEGTEEREDRREEDPGEEAYRDAFDNYLRYGEVSREERALLQTRFQRRPEERAQTVAQDIKGGFAVPDGAMQPITQAIQQFGGLRNSRVEVISTQTGRPIPFLTGDDTSNKGRLIGEGKSRSTTDVDLGRTVLNAYGYSSDFIKVSFELLQDIEMDIVSYIGQRAGERIGRITAEHFTTGDGASKPYGIATQASSGATAAKSATVAIDDLYELKHSVDPGYRLSAEWMLNDTTLKEIKKLKDGEGRPLWQSGVATGEPNSIDGDPYVVNQEMPDTASGNKAVLYGDMFSYKVRDVSGMSLRRLDERFADDGIVAFILFSRHDGALVDAGTGPVKALTMA